MNEVYLLLLESPENLEASLYSIAFLLLDCTNTQRVASESLKGSREHEGRGKVTPATVLMFKKKWVLLHCICRQALQGGDRLHLECEACGGNENKSNATTLSREPGDRQAGFRTG